MIDKENKAIKIGFAEEFHGETDLIIRELKEAEMNFEYSVVSKEAAFQEMLETFQPDIILSPYSLQDTNAIKLLRIARGSGFESPFILLAFDLSEDIAIDLLAEGVEDYVQRSTLKRLPVAIKKALQRYKTQLELQLSERKIRTSEQALRNMVRNAPIAVAMFDMGMNYMMVSQVWLTHEKKTEAEIIGRNHYDIVPELPEHWKKIHQKCLKGEARESEKEELVRADGSLEVIRWKMNPWYDSEGKIGGAVLFMEDITSTIQTQIDLEKTAKSLAVAQSIAKVGSWQMDTVSFKVNWSDEMFAIHGIEKQALNVELIRSLTHPDDLPLFDGAFSTLMEDQKPTDLVYRIIQPETKSIKHVRGLGRIEIAEDGSITDVSGIVQDISESIKNLNQLEKDQYLLAIGEELGGSGSFEFDLATQTPRWSENMYKVKGFDLEADISHYSYVKHVHPEDKPTYQNAFSKIMDGVAPQRFEYRLIRPDNGKVVHLRVHSTFIKDNAGVPIALMGSVQDLTQIKETQQSLKQSESALKVAQQIAKLGSWQWKKGENYPEVSDEVLAIYETKKKRISIDDIRSFIHPEDKNRVAKEALNDFSDDFKPVIEYRIITEKGNLKHVVTSAKQIRQTNGEIVQLLGTIQDITQRKKDQEQIETLSLVASETINGVLIQNESGRIEWSNKGFEKITGYTAEEAKNQKPWAILKGEKTNMKLADLTFSKLKQGKPFSTENVIYTKSGEAVWVTVAVSPILDDNDNLRKMVTVATDITKQKELENLQKNMLKKLEKDNENLKSGQS